MGLPVNNVLMAGMRGLSGGNKTVHSFSKCFQARPCPGLHRDSIELNRQKHLLCATSFLGQPCALELFSEDENVLPWCCPALWLLSTYNSQWDSGTE